jgi:hypothetical protein
VNGEATSVRPGSWNGAKARDGSPEDLRDPIGVHARVSRIMGDRRNKGPGLEGTSDFQERCGGTRSRRVGWAAEAN